MKPALYIIAFALLFIFSEMQGQTILNRYKKITSDDGLSQNLVWTIMQDHQGLLWFGTKDGLNSYDGYTFSHFRYDPSDSNSLSPGHILSLHECASGLVWIGFNNGKIDILDKKTGYVSHLDLPPSYPPGKPAPSIQSIVERTPVEHWIRIETGALFRVIKTREDVEQGLRRTEQFHLSYYETIGGIDLTKDVWYSLAADATGMLIADTHLGLLAIKEDSAAFVIPFPELGTSLTEGLFIDWGTTFDSDSSLWLAFWRTLYKFDRKTNEVVRYPLSITELENSTNGLPWFTQQHQSISSQSFWTFSRTYLFRINMQTKSIDYLAKLQPDVTDPALRAISMLCDPGGILWIGTPGDGIFKYNTKIERFGFLQGIKWATVKENAFQIFRSALQHSPHNIDKVIANFNERAVYRDSRGRYWIQDVLDKNNYSLGRLCLADSTGKLLKSYDVTKSPFKKTDMSYRAITEDRSGNLWLATFNSISRFNPTSETLDHFYFTEQSVKTLKPFSQDKPDGILVGFSCFKDANGWLWFDSGNKGLFCFNLETLELQSYKNIPGDNYSLSHNEIISLRDDLHNPKEILWIGTEGGGLNKFDKRTGKCIRYTTHDGLPNNVINGILFDKQGNLWLSTNLGICKFNPQTLETKTYDVNDGLQGNEFDRFKYFQSSDGMMFFGGVNGINAFYPEQVEDNNHVPPIVLTDLRLQNRSVAAANESSPLRFHIAYTESLSLPYSENVITFEFAALDYSNSKKNLYSYTLDGFSNGWSFPTTEQTATYTNLDPGEYVFRVRGSNNDGIWNMEGVSLTLIILPPWYMTWWFYSASAIFIIGGTFGLVRKRINRLKKEREVQEQFSRAVLENQEAERKRISGELHDSVGQNILLMKNRAHFGIQGAQDLPSAHQQLQEIAALASDTLNQVREISHNLRPLHLDRLGLTQAIHMLLDQVEKNSQITITATLASLDSLVSKDYEVNIFRIVQECLNNILKHAQAKNVIFHGEASQVAIHITIKDDGIGFDFDQKQRLTRNYGMGLSGLSERAKIIGGNLTIASSPGNGTTISLEIPIRETTETVSKV